MDAFTPQDTLRRMEEDRERVRFPSTSFLSDSPTSRRSSTDILSSSPYLGSFQHKRVREKLWVLPLPSPLSTTLPPTAVPLPFPRLASLLPSSTSPQSLSTPSDLAKSPSTSSITPQSPFTSSPSYGAAHPPAGANRSLRGNGVGLEGPIDREFDRAWDEVEEWDVVDLDLCKVRPLLLPLPPFETLSSPPHPLVTRETPSYSGVSNS